MVYSVTLGLSLYVSDPKRLRSSSVTRPKLTGGRRWTVHRVIYTHDKSSCRDRGDVTHPGGPGANCAHVRMSSHSTVCLKGLSVGEGLFANLFY
jgi:hypothetical protein